MTFFSSKTGVIRIGTSGFSYPEWVGGFYPAATKGQDMLPYYATRLNTVEVNNTFYRLPSPEVVEGWRTRVGPDFRFSVKASRRITHTRDFGVTDDFASVFLARVGALQTHLGPLLFQFPPYFGDLLKALAFVAQVREWIPRWVQAAPVMEVRHPHLLTPEFFRQALASGMNLCFNDEFLPVAQWPEPGEVVYLRLREETYSPQELQQFAAMVNAWSSQGKDCYVFFQHEGRATDLALALRAAVEGAAGNKEKR